MRKTPTPPLPSAADIEATRLHMRRFLLDLTAWLVDAYERMPKRGLVGAILNSPPMSAAMRTARAAVLRDLRAVTADLKGFLILSAVLRIQPLLNKRIATRHGARLAAPPGFRYARRRAALTRQIVGNTLGNLHRGSLRQRTERLNAILDNPDPYIATIALRIRACSTPAPAPRSSSSARKTSRANSASSSTSKSPTALRLKGRMRAAPQLA